MSNKSVNNAFYNISANLIKIVGVSVISFIVTGLLVRGLGAEMYGVVPLLSSMNKYIGLLTTVISASVGRFVSLSFFKGKMGDANKYYSSAFFGLLSISLIAFLVLYFSSFFIEYIFQFPAEKGDEVQWFFMLSVSALLISSLLSIFNVPAFIKHSFYLTDIVGLLSKVFQIILLFLVLEQLTVVWFGFSLLFSSLVSILLTYIISIRLIPELKLSFKNVSKSKLKDLSGMGFNSFFNSLGILLYSSSDIIIVNVLLGSVESGYYGIAVQLGMTVAMLGDSVTRILSPVMVELIAKEKRNDIINYIIRYTKLLIVFCGIPFVTIVVFSKPILGVWLGEGYEGLYMLVICVMINKLLHQTTALTFTYFNMRNKLRVPAIMTFATGILNIILSVILVKYTNLGIYGVALGTFISIFIKTVVFNVVYASKLLQISPFLIWKAVLNGLYWPVMVTVVSFVLFDHLAINSNYVLVVGVLAVLVVYMSGALYMPLSSNDRRLLFKILKLDKI